MFTIKHPPEIIFGENCAHDFSFPKNSLIITSKGTRSRGAIDYLGIENTLIFEQVEPNPSMETVQKIISQFHDTDFTHIIGLGGGSSLDIAKYVAFKMNKRKILIPTTFGSGSEVTRVSVLKVDGQKKSFHDDKLFADIAIVDPYFIKTCPFDIIKNSAVDACAQCTEAYDSTISNTYTKFFCEKAFDILEEGILNERYEKLSVGSLMAGIGFGNCSTTLGHALSYVFSNEGYSHGHALAFTTSVAHKFNNSIFYERFVKIVKKLEFSNIHLKQNLDTAAELILSDKKHLDCNPKKITKNEIINLLKIINGENVLS